MARKKSREGWGSIRRLPSGRYQARLAKMHGKRVTAPHTFATISEARSWLASMRSRIESGEVDSGQVVKAHTPTMHKIYLDRLGVIEMNHGSANTLRVYMSAWNVGLDKFWHDVEVGEVTEEMIATWDAQTSWPSNNAHSRSVALLSNLLKYAYDNGVIDTIPRGRVKLPKKRRRRAPVVATAEQIAVIRDNMPAELKVIIDLAAWCAMRFGEIAALRGKDIDLDKGTVHISRNIQRGPGGHQVEGSVKSQAGNRTVAIPPKALARVKTHYEQYGIGENDLVVWQPGSDGGEWLRNKEMHTRFDPAAAAAGLAGMRFHDLRHTGLTLAGEAGATLAELMARAGHSDVAAAMMYQHASLDRDRALAEKMEG